MLEWIKSREKLADLQQRVSQLEREKKTLELEWEDMYDKFRRLLARISKRQDQIEALEASQSHDRPDPRQLSLAPEGERVAALNRQILEQRRGRAVRQSTASEG